MAENQRRVKVSFRVAPETAKKIKKGASLFGECPSRFVDHVFTMAVS